MVPNIEKWNEILPCFSFYYSRCEIIGLNLLATSFLVSSFWHTKSTIKWLNCDFQAYSVVLRPGFEPGSPARKAGILGRAILPEQDCNQ